MQLIKISEWRYATKKFNPQKKVSDDKIELLKKIIQLTPTSYGLQPFKVFIIYNEKLKKKLLPFSYNQSQITDASHLFVFAGFTEITKKYIERFFRLKAKTQEKDYKEFIEYTNRLIKIFENQSEEQIKTYTSYQTYMALENLLLGCAELKIDACPIGGFIPEKYNNILELSKQKLNAVVVAAIGYRADNDSNQFLKKTRIPVEELFIEI